MTTIGWGGCLISIGLLAHASGAVHYVSLQGTDEPPYLTPETAATSILPAMALAEAGDVVFVSAGFWRQESFFVPWGVTLRGEAAALTFIDLIAETDDTYTLYPEDGAVVEDVTIGDSGSQSIWGAGAATLRRCNLGVAYLLGNHHKPLFQDCIFYGGLQCHDEGSPRLARCTLFGGADFYDGSTPVFEDCRFVTGGIRCEGTSSGTFIRCRDPSVSAYQGGTAEVVECRGVTGDSNRGSTLIIHRSLVRDVSCVESTLLLDNCLVQGSRWHGLHIEQNSVVELRNCAVTGNPVGLRFYYLGAPGAVVRLHNTVLAGNGVDFEGAADQVECSYSLVPPELVGTGPGNITGDPKFVDAENRDFRLLPDSACIDAGFNDPELPETDIAGMHRIMFGGKGLTVDMGAYEFYINKVEPVPGTDQTIFTWSSLAEKTYSIFYTDGLLTWHPAVENFPSSGNQTTSWTDDGSTTGVPPTLVPRRFYRTRENPQ
jgi:hypothetical protein